MAWDSAVIDMDEALKRVLGRKELYSKWLDTFFEDESLTPIIQAYEEGDCEELRLALHKIKGTAGNLSVMTVFNRALHISTEVKNGKELSILADEIEELRKDFYAAKEMYTHNVDELINYEGP